MTLGYRQLSARPTFCFANAGAYRRLDPDMNNPLEAIFCQLRQTADFEEPISLMLTRAPLMATMAFTPSSVGVICVR